MALNMEETAQVYELGYLVLPSIPEGQLGDVTAKLKSAITEAGGTELDSEAPLLMDLAYTMSKTVGVSRYVVSDAYMGWVKFEGEPSKVVQVKRAVEGIDEILRFLLVKAPRESRFTFEKARAVLAEKAGEVITPASPEPTDVVVQ